MSVDAPHTLTGEPWARSGHGDTVAAPMPSNTSPMPRPSRSIDWAGIIGPIVTFGVFIGVWYFMHYWGLRNIFDKPPFLIPAPHDVYEASFANSVVRGDMARALMWTTLAAIIGLILAIGLGMALATVMSQARWLERSLWPYLVALQAIPILAIVPIIALVFGYELNARVLVCIIISFFPIVSNTLFGLLSADVGQHDLFTLRGASRWTRLRKLQLPAAMPAVFTGFRIAAGLSVIGAVVGELFFRRGDKGIGILMEQYRQRNQYEEMYGALVLSVVLGIVVFTLFGWLGKVAVGRWHESTRKTG
jgi:NitT/TauT family transport system permease protein